MEVIAFFQSFQSEGLTAFFRLITFTGDETFYVIFMPILYWTWHRSKSAGLFTVVMFSLLLNFWLKELFQLPRPVGTALIEQGGFAFPSGHAQGSATLWIMLMLLTGKMWIRYLGAAMILLVAVSRIYLGVHFPMDILGGWFFAAAIILADWKFADVLSDFFKEKGPYQSSLYVTALLTLTTLVYPESEAVSITAALMGFLLLHINLKGVADLHPGAIYKSILTVIIGTAGILILWKGLKMVLPHGELFRFIRYAFIGAWIPLNARLFAGRAAAEGE